MTGAMAFLRLPGHGLSGWLPGFLQRRRRAATPVLVLGAAALLWPAGLAAQRDTTWRSLDTTRVSRRSERVGVKPPDFLFEQPRASIDLRVGMTFPRAAGDFFASNFQELTLSRSSFDGLTGALDFGFRIASRLDALLGVGYAHASKGSEERNWFDTGVTGRDSIPIQQHTTFTQLPITVGLRAYLLPRGQRIGHFVWVPTRVLPYVGVTGGLMHYTFTQDGDFVAAADSSIFSAAYDARGWTPVAQLLGGVDVQLGRRTAIKAEARYSFANGDLGNQFVGFKNGLDLRGVQTTLGLSWRY